MKYIAVIVIVLIAGSCSNEKKCNEIYDKIEECSKPKQKTAYYADDYDEQIKKLKEGRNDWVEKCKKNDKIAQCSESQSCLGLQTCLLSAGM